MVDRKTIKKIAFLSSVVVLLMVLVGVVHHFESRSIGYGSTMDSVPHRRSKNQCCSNINREGLDRLNAYGSGLINFRDFKARFEDKPEKVHVINLYPDEVYYYKDRPLKWYGLGFTKETLGNDAYKRKPFNGFFKPILRFLYGDPAVHDLSNLQTEEQIIQEMGHTYFMPLKNNREWLFHQEFMDDLIRHFESLPQDAVVYFHCFHGKGRTTTFMILYDIYRNYKKVSLQDIVNRHFCLGREDVFNTVVYAKGTWPKEALNARKNLVERFYTYMHDPLGYGRQTWTQWRKSKGFTEIKI